MEQRPQVPRKAADSFAFIPSFQTNSVPSITTTFGDQVGMVSVAPTPHHPSVAANSSGSGWRVRGSKLVRLWRRMQVSYYGGKYSIHRVLALEEYTKNTSPARVLLVFLATPLPMVVLVYSEELIPLQDLSESWSAHYGLWIRIAVLVTIVTHGLLIQGAYLIDNFIIPVCQTLLLYVIATIGIVVLSMILAAQLVFPIPFFVWLMTPPFYLLLVTSIRVVVGPQIMRQVLANRVQVSRCVRFVCAQTSTVAIFPVYEMLFRAAEGTRYQLPAVLLLPVIKVISKNVVLHYAKALEDMIPVEVIFTADFFNAVYIATCMQSATSVVTVLAITITDLSQSIIMLYGLQRRTTSILVRLRKAVHNANDHDDMLSMICSLCRNPASFRKQVHAGIRKQSCLPHQISQVNKRLLDSLSGILNENGAEYGKPPVQPVLALGPRFPSLLTQDITSSPGCFDLICTPTRTKVIHPDIPGVYKPPLLAKNAIPSQYPASNRSTILVESLETLFTTECLIITAYLEAFMPLFYCSYMLIMVHLRNAQYHTEMKGVTSENVGGTILPLFVFGLLQILSFMLLVVLIKKNCGMRALYQLAFVLEKQRSLVQCKMMLWMVITLCFRVVHFGVDFKFEFVRLGFPKFWTPHV